MLKLPSPTPPKTPTNAHTPHTHQSSTAHTAQISPDQNQMRMILFGIMSHPLQGFQKNGDNCCQDRDCSMLDDLFLPETNKTQNIKNVQILKNMNGYDLTGKLFTFTQ